MLTHLKKHALWYILGAIALIYVGISLWKKQWNPMNWFSGASGTVRYNKACCNDTNPCGWTRDTYNRVCKGA